MPDTLQSPANPRVAAPPPSVLQRAGMLARTARPYSLLWFVLVPMTTMAMLATGADPDVSTLVLMVVACMCGDGAYTTYNDLCDLKTDRLSVEAQRHTRPLASGALPVRWAKLQVIALSATCATLSFVISPQFGALLLAGMLYGAIYSGLGVRVVGRPFFSQLYWLALWPAMYLGVLIAVGGDSLAGLPYVVATTIFMGVGETLAKDLRDYENDLRGGRTTTPAAIGPARAATVAAWSFVLAGPLYIGAAWQTSPTDPRLALAVGVVWALWIVTVAGSARALRQEYSLEASRRLHVGSIRVFLTLSLLLAAGVPA